MVMGWNFLAENSSQGLVTLGKAIKWLALLSRAAVRLATDSQKPKVLSCFSCQIGFQPEIEVSLWILIGPQLWG